MGPHEREHGRAVAPLVALAVLAVIVTVVLTLVRAEPSRPADGAASPPSGSPPPQTGPSASGANAGPTPPATAAGPTSPAAEPTKAPPGAITLAFAGDVHFTGRTEPLLADPATAFGPIAETLSAADLAMVNLETAITEGGVEEPKQFHFRAPPTALDALAAAGIDVASMANNHAVDYGPTGLQDTLAAIEQGPVHVIGVGPDAAAAYAPYRTEVRGVGLSFFAVSQVQDRTYAAWTATADSPGIASTSDRSRLVDGVRTATANGDVVIVYVHWGIEEDPCPTGEMAQLAQDLAAAGADAIVGTHAHLLLGAGFSAEASDAYVAYGLGNFLWWRAEASSDDTGVLTLTVNGGRVVDAGFTPAVIDDDGRPQPVQGAQIGEKQAAFAELRGCTELTADAAH